MRFLNHFRDRFCEGVAGLQQLPVRVAFWARVRFQCRNLAQR
jgi:hypothetical protein